MSRTRTTELEVCLRTNNIVSFALGMSDVAREQRPRSDRLRSGDRSAACRTHNRESPLPVSSQTLWFSPYRRSPEVPDQVRQRMSTRFGADGASVQSITVDGVASFQPGGKRWSGCIADSGGFTMTARARDAHRRHRHQCRRWRVGHGDDDDQRFTFQPPTGFSSKSVDYVLVDRDSNTARSSTITSLVLAGPTTRRSCATMHVMHIRRRAVDPDP